MKELSFEQMEGFKGGGFWGCFFAIAGFGGAVAAAVMMTPVTLGASLVVGAFSFAGGVYSAVSSC